MFDWSGKIQISQGKVREKSGNFDILCEWQPCYRSINFDPCDKQTWP